MKRAYYTYKKMNYTTCEVSLAPIYEDDYIAIFNKPSGILVYSDGLDSNSMQKLVDNYYFDGIRCLVTQPIHRLDKDTKGLIIFSKSKDTQPVFDKMICQKEIKREYLAIVYGCIKKGKKYDFSDPIGKNRHISSKMIITNSGKKAMTHVLSLGTDGKYSVLNCLIETGRTHQIRIHLSYHGFPIVNDSLYGKGNEMNEINGLGLIAYRVSFIHPYTHESIEVNCDFDNTIKKFVSKVH